MESVAIKEILVLLCTKHRLKYLLRKLTFYREIRSRGLLKSWQYFLLWSTVIFKIKGKFFVPKETELILNYDLLLGSRKNQKLRRGSLSLSHIWKLIFCWFVYQNPNAIGRLRKSRFGSITPHSRNTFTPFGAQFIFGILICFNFDVFIKVCRCSTSLSGEFHRKRSVIQ